MSAIAEYRNESWYSLGLIEPPNRTEYFEMTTNLLVAFYSTYGHVHRMALAVAEGAETVRLRRIAEPLRAGRM